MNYREIFEQLDMSERLTEVALGETELPSWSIEVDNEPEGFLPAMVPIWREDTSYYGVWVNPITGSFYYGYSNPETDYRVSKLSDTSSGFIFLYLFNEISINGMVDEVRHAADVLGVEGIEDIHETYNQHGFNPESYIKLQSIVNDFGLNDVYGSPLFSLPGSSKDIESYCSVEVPEDAISTLAYLPEWFDRSRVEALFYRYIDCGNANLAWLTLNSNGWPFSQAKVAFSAMAEKFPDNFFLNRLAELWCSFSHENYGGY